MQSNPDFELAYHIVEHTDTNLFLTGRAGTGKTTFLRTLTGRSSKRVVVAAPTGIAAINAGGVTLHSLFQLDFGPFVPGRKRKPLRFSREKMRVIKFMDVLVIDEISMVRADLLDAVDDMLRRVRNPHLPFGGVQLLLIGDLRQLPPVVTDEERHILAQAYDTPYFFSSHALAMSRYVTIELQKVYRQENEHFLSILAAIRDGNPPEHVIRELNARHLPGFVPDDGGHWVHLTSHNATANSINAERLGALRSPEHCYRASVTGNFPAGVFPAEESLVLKEGAQVMFIKNDPSPEKRFFNGMLGTVAALGQDSVTVRPSDGSPDVEVGPLGWENRKYEVDAKTGEVEERVDGMFSQIPLRLAWAITIHKSQGLTFSHAIIDVSACFAHGQAYVALSRLRTLDGLVLSAPVPRHAIISDPEVRGFMATRGSARPSSEEMADMEMRYSSNLLDSVYDFLPEMTAMEDLHRLVADAYHSTYPSVVKEYGVRQETFKTEVAATASVFRAQYARLLATSDSRPLLTERLAASAGYFPKKVGDLLSFLTRMPEDIDNAETKKRLKSRMEPLTEALAMKAHIISTFATIPFSNESLLQAKRDFMLGQERGRRRKGGQAESAKGGKKADTPTEVRDPALFKALVAWRKAEAQRRGIPAFRILSTRSLINISNLKPCTRREFQEVPGCGPRTAELYAETVMDIISDSSREGSEE